MSATVYYRSNTKGGDWISSPVKKTEFLPHLTGVAEPYFRYRSDLMGLTPGDSYDYRVFLEGQEITPRANTFRTDDGSPFRFIAFGDSGMASPDQLRLAAKMNTEAADVVLPLGDLAYPMATYQALDQNYFNVYAPLMARSPFFATPGNHDYYFEDGAAFVAACVVPSEGVPAGNEGRFYSFDWGPVHFIALDTNSPLTKCVLDNDTRMIDWLEQDLSRTRKFWRIAYFHHPPYASGAHESEHEAAWVRERIVPVLEKYGVQLVLSGHEHSYQRTKPMSAHAPTDGPSATVYVTSGGAGAYLYRHEMRPHIAVSAVEFHYVAGEVSQGKLKMRAVATGDAADLDAITIAPPPYLRGAPVNSASQTTAVAEGSLISIYGRNLAFQEILRPRTEPGDAGGVTVKLDGNPLRLLYASPDQINAVLPAHAAGDHELTIANSNGVVKTTITVSEIAPAIFVDNRGPLVFHDDNTMVSERRPVGVGERITVYLTGLGSALDGVEVLFDQSVYMAQSVRVTEMPGVFALTANTPWHIPSDHLRVTIRARGIYSNPVSLAATPSREESGGLAADRNQLRY